MDVSILWDLDDDQRGNVRHIQEHGIDKEDVVNVFDAPVGTAISDSTRRPMVFGYTADGRYIAVIYEQVDKDTVYPITAFEVPDPA